MTSISSYAAHDGSPRAIKVGKSWSLRAMQIVEQAILDNGGNFDGPAANCVRAQGVGLYNLGMLAEVGPGRCCLTMNADISRWKGMSWLPMTCSGER